MKIVSQTINLSGFVSNIEIDPDEYLLPLQEVIVNSIQSVEDKPNTSQSSIGIKIIRSVEPILSEEEFEEPYYPITGFEVTDNGVGFIEERFNAFNEIYTDINKAKGCKGVGRYSVLACFHDMDVDSTYQDNNEWKRRIFKFSAKDGVVIDKDSIELQVEQEVLSTKVRLNNYKKDFIDYINKNRISIKEISEAIIHHCMLYFTSKDVPLMRIYYDGDKDNAIILNNLFSEVIKFDREPQNTNIEGEDSPFTLNYIRNYANRAHSMHLCANKREVGKKISLSSYIPSFVKPLQDSLDKKYYLSVYVTGDLLDRRVNSQRTKFSIPLKKDDDNAIFNSICLQDIFNNISENVKKEYKKNIEDAEKEKDNRVRNYILDKKKPRLAYRHLIGIEGAFDNIPADATDERIEAELHKKTFQLEQKRAKAFDKAFAKKKYDGEEFSNIIQSVLSEEAKFSADKLADLMVRRKSVLKLFRKYLEWRNDDKKYMLEKDLHNIIFTMGAETDVMPQEYHNLWLLDERLAFHRYTTSDKALCTNQHIDNDSKKETDLLIYDFPWAFTDNPNHVNSLVIFEFKRPGRDMNTTDDKKLDSQVLGYFEKLLESKAKSDKGKLLNIQKTTPKFGYVICDLHKDLVEYNRDFNGFMTTPYGTLFKINSNLNMYIEVMDYDTMLDFAEKRHDSFFQALGIDSL